MKKSFKENMKNISNFLKLLKTQIIERKFQNMLKKIFKVYQSIQFCIKKKNKYNTTDQTVDMQAVNFVLMKHN